jgi:hypothetical protein
MITPFSFTSFYPVTHKIQKKKPEGAVSHRRFPDIATFATIRRGVLATMSFGKSTYPRLNSRRGHVCSHLFRNEELLTTLAQHQSTLNFHHPNLLVGIHFSIASKEVCPKAI